MFEDSKSILKKFSFNFFKFLLNLGLDQRTAAADAEGIEHHVSEKTLKKMDKFNSKK